MRAFASTFILWSILAVTVTVALVTVGFMIAPIIFVGVLGYGYYRLNKTHIDEALNINQEDPKE